MNIVKFPGLNLEFKFSKIAFSLFGINIYKYAVCIVLGILVALILCKISKQKYGIEYNFVLENFIIGMLFGIIGARIYFVLFNFNYFSKNVFEIFNIRNGGLAIYGGLILSGIAIMINCKIKKKDILNFLDYVIPYISIAQCIGRFGNFFNIEAYGYETNSILRMGIVKMGKYTEVHPVFLYEAIGTFIIFVILKNIQKKRKFKGEIILLYLIFYSGIRAVLENLRIDSLMLFNWRISRDFVCFNIFWFISCINMSKFVYQKISQILIIY